MPTLARFGKTRVFLNTDDHDPPHAHVRGPGYIAKVRLEDGTIMAEAGKSHASAREAVAWVGQNGPSLLAAWREIHKGR